MRKLSRIYFDVLGLSTNVTYQKAYNRYRYLVKKNHPDKGGNAEDFRVIQEAWEKVKPLLPKKKPIYPMKPIFVVSKSDRNILLRWVDFKDKGNSLVSFKDWVSYHRHGNILRLEETNVRIPYPADLEREISIDLVTILTRSEYCDLKFGGTS